MCGIPKRRPRHHYRDHIAESEQPQRVLNVHGTKGRIQLTEGNITRWEVEGEEPFSVELEDVGTGQNPTNFSHELHQRQLLDFIEAVRTTGLFLTNSL